MVKTETVRGRAALRLVLVLCPLLLLTVFSVRSVLYAHIIPPEKLHPAAASYRRMTFVLNLNPVRWNLVRAEARNLARELQKEDSEAARIYLREVEALLEPWLNPRSERPGSAERKTTARSVFELSTRATARLLAICLDEVERSCDDPARAARDLNEARQIWASFEPEVKATDSEAYARMGQAWLEASTALGSPGVLGVGAVSADRARVHEAIAAIEGYVQNAYGEEFRALPDRRLAPLPVSSTTFDAGASVPPRLPPGTDINKQVPRPRQILNMVARGVDENETALIALGDMAFDSTFIFGEPARSFQITCNTCHNKGVTNPRFFIPGLSARPGGMDVSSSFFEPQANNGHFDHVDSPDLRGIRFTGPYGRNGRTASLREFVRNVIVLEFNGPEPDPMIVDAMVAYMNEFDFLPNPNLNPDGSLTSKASAAARRGEKIFNRPFPQMKNRACATCHIPSDHFLDRRRHNLGSGRPAAPHALDGAFDTPTLLGAKYTQPYFHDGNLPTLRAVNEWFNRKYQLKLTPAQIADLTTYVEAVGDGVEAYEDSPYYLDAEMEEFSFFLSSYEFLKSRQKWELIDITLNTIASEIRNHKWELRDPDHMPVMERLAEIAEEARVAIGKQDLKAADAKVEEYRHLYQANVEKLQ